MLYHLMFNKVMLKCCESQNIRYLSHRHTHIFTQYWDRLRLTISYFVKRTNTKFRVLKFVEIYDFFDYPDTNDFLEIPLSTSFFG